MKNVQPEHRAALQSIFTRYDTDHVAALTQEQLNCVNLACGSPQLDKDTYDWIVSNYDSDLEGRLTLLGFLDFFDDLAVENPGEFDDIVAKLDTRSSGDPPDHTTGEGQEESEDFLLVNLELDDDGASDVVSYPTLSPTTNVRPCHPLVPDESLSQYELSTEPAPAPKAQDHLSPEQPWWFNPCPETPSEEPLHTCRVHSAPQAESVIALPPQPPPPPPAQTTPISQPQLQLFPHLASTTQQCHPVPQTQPRSRGAQPPQQTPSPAPKPSAHTPLHDPNGSGEEEDAVLQLVARFGPIGDIDHLHCIPALNWELSILDQLIVSATGSGLAALQERRRRVSELLCNLHANLDNGRLTPHSYWRLHSLAIVRQQDLVANLGQQYGDLLGAAVRHVERRLSIMREAESRPTELGAGSNHECQVNQPEAAVVASDSSEDEDLLQYERELEQAESCAPGGGLSPAMQNSTLSHLSAALSSGWAETARQQAEARRAARQQKRRHAGPTTAQGKATVQAVRSALAEFSHLSSLLQGDKGKRTPEVTQSASATKDQMGQHAQHK